MTRWRDNQTKGSWHALALLVALLPVSLVTLRADGRVGLPVEIMPQVEDYTFMWWADGFPGNTPAKPWRRVIQTGRYAMALDTETLRIPNFGPVSAGGYAATARSDNRLWQSLPAADLALSITAGGKTYRCTAGGKWTNFTGPRLIESGRFLQRADVTDLAFTADDGARLNVEARFETVAWPDRLALILAARPGLMPIPAGEACFGRIGGGFGLTGTNHFELPHAAALDQEKFTLEMWVFVPQDYRPSQQTFPWLVCKNHHEEADGNYGIVLLDDRPQARMNIGGGRENAFVAGGGVHLKIQEWNHLAMSYDGDTLRIYVNGELSGETKIGRTRKPGHDGLAIGRRQDNCGDGYHFRGVVDEIRIYDHALTMDQIRSHFAKPEKSDPSPGPVCHVPFSDRVQAAMTIPRESWKDAAMEIGLTTGNHVLRRRWDLPQNQIWSGEGWQEVSITPLDDGVIAAKPGEDISPVSVRASEIPDAKPRPVDYDAARGWHRVNLDGIEPVTPAGQPEKKNDAIERVKLVLSNPADRGQVVRLLFEKTAGGFRQHIGSSITGMSAILRDANGQPTGIPVQLSKDWHTRPEGGVYAGTWFHGFSQVRLPPHAIVELELTIVYGHWGGVAAASHAQLSLVGWGSNQLWDQSAMGSWGESICYEPDQAQAQCGILDVRPLMVNSVSGNQRWGWTHNVGGGDFFRLFDAAGQRVFPTRMRTTYGKHGPCLTEVTYAGQTGDGIEHAATVSLARTDDIVRGIYQLRFDVTRPVDFSRFVIFQIGADSYSYTGERKMAFGNESGLVKEWATQWGGGINRTQPLECAGRVPWISLHEGGGEPFQVRSRDATPNLVERKKPDGAWANRGIVIRSWKARIGGKPALPWLVEHGVRARGEDSSTADIVPPPGVTRLLPGDFVEATFEHLIMPQFASDYYGPNEGLRATLEKDANTWRMIHREATGNDRRVEMKTGKLESLHPAVRVRAVEDRAEFTIAGGLGYVPITIGGLTSPRGHALFLDDRPLDQGVHGNDWWQGDYDPESQCWSQTFNAPLDAGRSHRVRFGPGTQ